MNNPILDLYRDSGQSLLDKYFWSIFFFVLINLSILLLLLYLRIKTKAQQIKANWANEKCKLQNIPFAGIIMEPSDMTATEFTEKNFVECQQSIIQSIFQLLTEPMAVMATKLISVFGEFSNQIQFLRKLLEQLRKTVAALIQKCMEAIAGILVPFQQLIIVFEDTSNKINAVFKAGIYVVMTIILTMQGMFKIMVDVVVEFFIMIVAAIISLFFGTLTAPIGAALLTVFVALSNPFKLILKFLKSVLKVSASKNMPTTPKKPSHINTRVCFHPNTLVDSTRTIKDLKVGDTLSDGTEVKAVFILLAGPHEKYYTPFHGCSEIVVTSLHKVKSYSGNWIYVKDHPAFCPFEFVKPPDIVYCLNTSTKRIILGEYAFLDWDEVESEEMAKSWYTRFEPPPKRAFNINLFDSGVIGIVDLGDENWQPINPSSASQDYDSYAEKYLEQ